MFRSGTGTQQDYGTNGLTFSWTYKTQSKRFFLTSFLAPEIYYSQNTTSIFRIMYDKVLGGTFYLC